MGAHMDVILLGGNSAANQGWVRVLAATLASDGTAVIPHMYRHWETGDKLIDLDTELRVLRQMIPSSRPHAIVGKSAGALLALKGIREKILSPAKCVFIGTAIPWGRANGFPIDTWLKGYTTPTLFLQQAGDPAMSAEDLLKTLEAASVANYKLVELPGDDHEYADVASLAQRIRAFLLQ